MNTAEDFGSLVNSIKKLIVWRRHSEEFDTEFIGILNVKASFRASNHILDLFGIEDKIKTEIAYKIIDLLYKRSDSEILDLLNQLRRYYSFSFFSSSSFKEISEIERKILSLSKYTARI